MTTPTQHGYPDWGRQAAAADINVFKLNAFAQGALSVGRGTYFVGNMPFLHINQSVDAGGLRTRLNFVDAKSGGDFVSVVAIDTLAGLVCSGPIAVTAPYVQIFTDVDVIGRQITVRISQNYQWGADFRASLHNAMLAIDGLNVNAAENEVLESPNVRWGWGYFNCHLEAAAAGRIRLLALDYLGATQLLAYWINGSDPIATVLTLPPRPVRLEVLNSDAVARTLYASLYFHTGPF